MYLHKNIIFILFVSWCYHVVLPQPILGLIIENKLCILTEAWNLEYKFSLKSLHGEHFNTMGCIIY